MASGETNELVIYDDLGRRMSLTRGNGASSGMPLRA